MPQFLIKFSVKITNYLYHRYLQLHE